LKKSRTSRFIHGSLFSCRPDSDGDGGFDGSLLQRNGPAFSFISLPSNNPEESMITFVFEDYSWQF
jgi:hypothetical protein